MSASTSFEKYAINASSAMAEEIAERIRQLTHKIRALQQQLQSLLASVPEHDLRVLRQRIQIHHQQILRLEKANADNRHRQAGYVSLAHASYL
jgi:phage shock protein A